MYENVDYYEDVISGQRGLSQGSCGLLAAKLVLVPDDGLTGLSQYNSLYFYLEFGKILLERALEEL